MYLKHFGFKRQPFTPVPDDRELFQTRGHQEAKARLKVAFDDRVPILLYGEPGVGKTTTVHSALADLDRRQHRVIEISDPRLKLRGFYSTLADGLGLQPAYFFNDLSKQVRAAIAAATEKEGQHPVVVVDEAQMLTEETIDSLRLLTNPLLGQKKPGVTLVLVGDMTLRRRLSRPYFEAFVQRLRMTYRMPGLDEEEGRRYVAHRVRIAGGNPDIFDPAAVDELLAMADGRLRAIDDLCSQALYVAFIARAKVAGKEHVEVVKGDRLCHA